MLECLSEYRGSVNVLHDRLYSMSTLLMHGTVQRCVLCTADISPPSIADDAAAASSYQAFFADHDSQVSTSTHLRPSLKTPTHYVH